MSSYFIAQIKIMDKNKYEKYLEGYNAVFNKYKGEIIIVEDSPTILEGEWSYTRIVVIRFPNERDLRSWYESDEYQRLAKYRWDASDADILIVNGRS